MSSDQEIIGRVLSGDYDAFEILVDKYEGRVYRHLRKMVNNNDLAADLLQETFLSAYKGLKGFAGSSSFSTWLFRIATNAALMYLRKNRPEIVEYDDHIRANAESAIVAASPELVGTPFDILLSAEGCKKIEEAIDNLPVLYRSAIVLRDVEGFSLEEVARIMNSSVAAVKSRLHRARNAVREALATYYSERGASAARRASK
jgi:RNA polymerase sigma-70 factor (ECF subfamily)